MAFRIGRTRVLSSGERQFERSCGRILLYTLMVIAAVGLPLYAYKSEREYFSLTQAAKEGKYIVQQIGSDDHVDPSLNGALIHFPSNRLEPENELVDPNFSLSFPRAVKYQRHAEYCQWQEHSHDKTETDSDGNERTVRTYTYSKTWLPYRVPSLLFDQPGAHHNPQRDPYPSISRSVNSAKAGVFTLNRSLIDKMTMSSTVKYTHDNPPVQVGPAYEADNFKYIGNGYFYSAYTPSGAEVAVKLFAQYLEGSILDFQIGDLFSHCTAGDIRVHYTVVAPREFSVIAKQVDSDGNLDLYTTSKGYKLGYVHKGIVDAVTMFDNELYYLRWGRVLISRIGLLFWAALVLFMVNPSFLQVKQLYAISLLILSAATLAAFWLVIWGTTLAGIALFSLSVGMFVLLPSPDKAKVN